MENETHDPIRTDAGNGAEEAQPQIASLLNDVLSLNARRAYALRCQGLQTSQIAAVIGVSPRQVRRYLAATRRVNEEDEARGQREQLRRAIESQQALASAAWVRFEQDTQREAEVLDGKHDRLRRRVLRRPRMAKPGRPAKAALEAAEANTTLLTEEWERPRFTSHGAQYLALVLAAQTRIAQMQGLLDRMVPEPQAVHLTITRQLDASTTAPSDAALVDPAREP